MNDIFQNIYASGYFFLYVALFALYMKKGGLFGVNSTKFLILYYLITSFVSILYLNACDGLYRNYSNLSFSPYLYLFVCFVICLSPVFIFDRISNDVSLNLTPRKIRIMKWTSIFIGLCSIEPFFESVLRIPAAMSSDTALANAYAAQLAGQSREYLSFIGRKFFTIIWSLNNLVPFLIFFALLCRFNKKIIIGLLLSLSTIWIHSMVLGGRSILVQNVMLLTVVYFLFKQYLSPKVNKAIVKYGLIFIALAVVAIVTVSVSRFDSMGKSAKDMSGVWEWIGLYAGEGTLNFNSEAWHISRFSNGLLTLGFPYYIISGTRLSVAEIWQLKNTMGVHGNYFFTYIGTFFMDYGAMGTILVFIGITFVLNYVVNLKRHQNTCRRLLFMGLWLKVLIIGPILYTYGTVDDQMNLVIALFFGLFI